jgi:hypothetical protein
MYAFIADISGEKSPTGKEGDEEDGAGEYDKGSGMENRFALSTYLHFRF